MSMLTYWMQCISSKCNRSPCNDSMKQHNIYSIRTQIHWFDLNEVFSVNFSDNNLELLYELRLGRIYLTWIKMAKLIIWKKHKSSNPKHTDKREYWSCHQWLTKWKWKKKVSYLWNPKQSQKISYLDGCYRWCSTNNARYHFSNLCLITMVFATINVADWTWFVVCEVKRPEV